MAGSMRGLSMQDECQIWTSASSGKQQKHLCSGCIQGHGRSLGKSIFYAADLILIINLSCHRARPGLKQPESSLASLIWPHSNVFFLVTQISLAIIVEESETRSKLWAITEMSAAIYDCSHFPADKLKSFHCTRFENIKNNTQQLQVCGDQPQSHSYSQIPLYFPPSRCAYVQGTQNSITAYTTPYQAWATRCSEHRFGLHGFCKKWKRKKKTLHFILETWSRSGPTHREDTTVMATSKLSP